MSDIFNMLKSQMTEGALQSLAGQIGADKGSTQSALSAAVPMMVQALANNARSDEGASSLAGALERDHDGSILDNLGGFLSQGDTSPGNSILKHVFGQKRQIVEGGVSEMSGLDQGQTGKLIAMVAPVVLGALGKKKQQQGLDAGGLASMLTQEKAQVVENNDNPAINMLTQLLDADGDGSAVDDIAGAIGKNILGNLFGGKK